MNLPIKNCGVYKITCTETGDSYIGASSNLYKRIGHHLSLLNSDNHHKCKDLQHLWNTYSSDKFTVEILEICEEKYLLIKETKWIRTLAPTLNNIKDTTRAGTSIKILQKSD